jgi:exopolysaccharide biosynthesis polyprenyl glycosylphosphotransferase
MVQPMIETVVRPESASRTAGLLALLFSYKPALVAHDLAVALAAGVGGAWIAGGFYPELDPAQKVLLIGLCMTPVAFFTTFHLYSYHLIFSRRYHVAGIAKACSLSLITFGAVILTYTWTSFMPPTLFAVAVMGTAVLLLVLDRLMGDRMVPLLKAFGLACMGVGLAGLVGLLDPSVFRTHLEAAVAGFVAVICAIAVSRYAVVHLVFNRLLRRRFRRQAVIIGEGPKAERLIERIVHMDAPFWVCGTVGGRADGASGKPVLGRMGEIEALSERMAVQEVIITDPTIEKPELIRLIDFFTTRGTGVWFVPELMPIIDVKLHIDSLCGAPMIRLGSHRFQGLFRKIKHSVDAIAALTGCTLALPLFIVFAAAIRLGSPGPVFYRARAIGKGGRFFSMYKFRTMLTGASKELHKEFVTRMIRGDLTADGSGRTTLKITNDPRVTAIGRILRRTSLDELPQLINVLRGEMSLVGPRPCLPYEYELYKDWHKKRTSVRPGITGLWQVVGRSEVSFEDMILLDLYYIYNRSLELDLNILLETFFVVLKKKGAH